MARQSAGVGDDAKAFGTIYLNTKNTGLFRTNCVGLRIDRPGKDAYNYDSISL